MKYISTIIMSLFLFFGSVSQVNAVPASSSYELAMAEEIKKKEKTKKKKMKKAGKKKKGFFSKIFGSK